MDVKADRNDFRVAMLLSKSAWAIRCSRELLKRLELLLDRGLRPRKVPRKSGEEPAVEPRRRLKKPFPH